MFCSVLIRIETYPVFSALNALALVLVLGAGVLVPSLPTVTDRWVALVL